MDSNKNKSTVSVWVPRRSPLCTCTGAASHTIDSPGDTEIHVVATHQALSTIWVNSVRQSPEKLAPPSAGSASGSMGTVRDTALGWYTRLVVLYSKEKPVPEKEQLRQAELSMPRPGGPYCKSKGHADHRTHTHLSMELAPQLRQSSCDKRAAPTATVNTTCNLGQAAGHSTKAYRQQEAGSKLSSAHTHSCTGADATAHGATAVASVPSLAHCSTDRQHSNTVC